MPFEFKIRQKLELKEKSFEGIDEKELLNILQNHILTKELLEPKREGNRISLLSNRSLLYYNYQTVFQIQKNDEETFVLFEYSLVPVFKITVIMILFAAFFSKFSINNLLIFSGIFVIIFFAFNIIYINGELKNIIFKALMPERLNTEEVLTQQQEEWIKNPKKCPACGEEISDYNFICPECGLSINPKNSRKNMNVSDFYDLKFKYKITGEKDKGDKVKNEKKKEEK